MTDSPPPSSSMPPERRRHERRAQIPWLAGVILVGLGLIFLFRNLEIFDLEQWWALFFLIPAAASFSDAWRHYRQAGEMKGRAVGSVIAGVLFVILTIAFLFGFDWRTYWPLILILVGIAVLAGAYWRRS